MDGFAPLRRVLLAVCLLTLLAATTIAPVGAASGPSGWSRPLADDQGTWRGGADGPAVPAVRWTHRVPGTYTAGREEGPHFGHKDLVAIDGLGQLLVRVEVGDFPGGTPTLVALDGDTGEEAWRVSGIMPRCAPTVGPDGTLWVVVKPTVSDDPVLTGIDPATGEPVPGRTFSKTENSAADPSFQPCDFTGGIRFLSDGTILVRERSFTTADREWIRAIDGTTMDQKWIRGLVRTSGTEASNRWSPDLRIGREDADNADTIYLVERVSETSGAGSFSLLLHALRASDGQTLDTIPIPGTDGAAYDAELVVDGTTLYGSTKEDDAQADPTIDDNVNGWIWAVEDDGDGNLSVLWQRPTRSGASFDGDTARFHLTDLTLGDGSTLIARTFASAGTIVGVRASDGRKAWDLSPYQCLTGHVVVDASGTGYFIDFCDRVLASVTPDGRVRWTMPLRGQVPVAGGGTVSLDQFESFRVQAIAPNGDVVLTAQEAGQADDHVVLTVALGDFVERRAGTNRIETAVELSKLLFPADGTVRTVVLARADAYPDALSGAPLAFAVGSPLILTSSTELSPAARTEITRLGATKAILLGGEAALEPGVVAGLAAIGVTDIERIAGTNRFDTARLVRQRLGATEAVVVEGSNPNPERGWPDAVAASGWAAQTGRAILLVTRDALPSETATALEGIDDAVIVGGSAAVSDAVRAQVDAIAGTVDRIAGASRYATSAMVADRSVADGASLDVVWLATGTGFPDALAAGPATAFTSGVLLLVHGQLPDAGEETYAFLTAHAADIGVVYLVGGTAAISDAVAAKVDTTLGR